MDTRFRGLIRSGLPMLGVLMFGGCNSPQTAPPSSSTTTGAQSASTSAPRAAAPVTVSNDGPPAPQRKPPAGMGNAIGRVLYDGKGASNIEVRLCEEIRLVGGCGGKTFLSKTNKDGFYVIDKVKPGGYSLAVRVFNSNSFIYPTTGIMSAAKFQVAKDESLSIPAVNLWKTNLQVESPKNGTTIKTDKPKLAWKAYPSAANYKVTVRTKQGVGSLSTMETAEPSVTPEKSLLNGDYQWRIEAFNGEGTKIAETASDATFKIVGQAGSNTVALVNPKANTTVSGKDLTLQWKAHPQAQEYRVYLKGVSAKESVLSFESMNGTSHKLAAPLPADQYFWSVEAFKDNERVAGSALERFIVK